MLLREIQCGVLGCTEKFMEEFYNQGFPQWIDINGLTAKIQMENGKTIVMDKFFICPKHRAIIEKLLHSGLDHLL